MNIGHKTKNMKNIQLEIVYHIYFACRSRANVQHIDDFANQIIIYFMGSKPNITKRY